MFLEKKTSINNQKIKTEVNNFINKKHCLYLNFNNYKKETFLGDRE